MAQRHHSHISSEGMPVANAQIPRATLVALEELASQMEALNEHLSSSVSESGSRERQLEQELKIAQARQSSAPASNVSTGAANVQAAVEAQEKRKAQQQELQDALQNAPERRPSKNREGLNPSWSQNRTASELEPSERSILGNPNPTYEHRNTQDSEPEESSLKRRLKMIYRGEEMSSIPGVTKAQYDSYAGREYNPISGEFDEIDKTKPLSNYNLLPYGERQMDTYFKMARDVAAGYAARNSTPNPETGELEPSNFLASSAERISKIAALGANNSNQIKGAINTLRDFDSHFSNAEEIGRSLGYSAQNGWFPSTIGGIHIPFVSASSQAGQMGEGIQLNATEISRLGTGLKKSEADEIVESLATQGYRNQYSTIPGAHFMNRGDLDTLATQVVAPMVKEMGLKPEVAAGITGEVFRNGVTSIEEFKETMSDLPSAAEASREGINEFTVSLQEFAEQASSFGANKQQAYQSGLEFTNSTGLNPRFLGQMQQSPFVQSLALTQTGTLPSGLGALPGGTQLHLSQEAMKLAMNATKGYATPKYETINGHRIEVETGEEAQQAQAAQLMGIEPEIFERLWRNRGHIEGASRAETLIGSPEGLNNRIRLARKEDKRQGIKNLTSEQIQELHQGATGWDEVEKELHKAGVSAKRIHKIDEISLNKLNKEGKTERIAAAEAALAKHNEESIYKEGQQEIKVGFTPQAAKYFRQVPLTTRKARSNAGKELITQHAAEPTGTREEEHTWLTEKTQANRP